MRMDDGAFGGDARCPDPGRIHAWVSESLAEAEARDVESHVLECERCSRESLLAAEFDRGGVAPAPHAGDLAHVRERASRAIDRLAALPARRLPFAAAALAGVAVAVVVFVALASPFSAPSVTAPSADSPRRGARIALFEPAGRLTEPPAIFRWEPVPRAARYRVSVRSSSLREEILSAFTTGAEWRPAGSGATLADSGRFTWSVEAFDGSSSRIAASDEESFLIEAAPAESPEGEKDR